MKTRRTLELPPPNSPTEQRAEELHLGGKCRKDMSADKKGIRWEIARNGLVG